MCAGMRTYGLFLRASRARRRASADLRTNARDIRARRERKSVLHVPTSIHLNVQMWLRPFPHAPLLPAAACAVVLRQAGDRGARPALLSRPVRVQRGQRLAYDGMYDTPPVTWYYPATGNAGGAANTLGYTCVPTPRGPAPASREAPSPS